MFVAFFARRGVRLRADCAFKGIVTDSVSGEPLPYASVQLESTGKGAMTDADGRFSFTASKKRAVLEVSYLGYDTKKVRVEPGKSGNLHVRLVPSGIALEEVIVKPKRERYRRRDNPAVAFVRKVIDARDGMIRATATISATTVTSVSCLP